MLIEKYDFSEQDASDLADFLMPVLDFVPEKRPTAAECLSHPWITAGPRLLEPSVAGNQPPAKDGGTSESKRKDKDEREAMEAGVGNIAIDGTTKSIKESQPVLN